MLFSRLRLINPFLICMMFLSGNAQVSSLMTVLKNQSSTMKLSALQRSSSGQYESANLEKISAGAYQVSHSGKVISFYKMVNSVKKMIVSVDFNKIDPTEVFATSTGNSTLLNLAGQGAIRYFDPASGSYKFKGILYLDFKRYKYPDNLHKIAKKAAYALVPKKDMKVVCYGNVKMMPYLSVTIRDDLDYNVFREQKARFKVVGNRGELTVRQVPLGTKLGISILWPSSGAQAEDGFIFQTYKMPETLGKWNTRKQRARGRDPHIRIEKKI